MITREKLLVKTIARDLMERIKDPSIGQRERWKSFGIGVEKPQKEVFVPSDSDGDKRHKAELKRYFVGKKVGSLVVLEPPLGAAHGYTIRCQCDCGFIEWVYTQVLKNGEAKCSKCKMLKEERTKFQRLLAKRKQLTQG